MIAPFHDILGITMQGAFVLAVIVTALVAYPICNGFPESQSDDSTYLASEVSTNNSQWDSADVETSDAQLQGLHAHAFTLTELVLPSFTVFPSERLVADALLQVRPAPWLLRSFERGPPHSYI
jgi:hypothetical protein